MIISVYIFLLCLTFVFAAGAVFMYDHEKYIDVAAGVIAAILGFICANKAIDGTVYSLVSTGTATPYIDVFEDITLHYFMQLIGVMAVLYVVFAVIMIIIQSFWNLRDV